MMRRRPVVKRLFTRLIFVLLSCPGAQVVRPARTNPPTDPNKSIYKTIEVPKNVQAVFDRACRDCHSRTPPGRGNLTWPRCPGASNQPRQRGPRAHELLELALGAQEAGDLLDSTCKEVKKGRMPLGQYLLLHDEAKLTDPDKKLLCDWATAAAGSCTEARGTIVARRLGATGAGCSAPRSTSAAPATSAPGRCLSDEQRRTPVRRHAVCLPLPSHLAELAASQPRMARRSRLAPSRAPGTPRPRRARASRAGKASLSGATRRRAFVRLSSRCGTTPARCVGVQDASRDTWHPGMVGV